MTHSESVQRAYRWAFSVYNDPKSRMLHRLCAKQVLEAIEGAQDNSDAAHTAILELIRDWVRHSKGSTGLDRPIKTLGKILNVEAEDLSAEVQPEPLR